MTAATTTSACSVLLWLRPDVPREQTRAYWAGPHAKLAAQTHGVREYRQLHFSAESHFAWPALADVNTVIDAARRVDGTPEVTFERAWSPLIGGPVVERIRRDERNAFARTVFHLTGPGGARWFRSGYGATVGARAVILLRRRDGARGLKNFVHGAFGPALDRCPGVLELRTQTFLPFVKYAWNTPGVQHDYPRDERFHGLAVVGATDAATLERALAAVNGELAADLRRQLSAIHVYEVEDAYTFRVDGHAVLTPPERPLRTPA
jgi:hypothetical protein